jgi:hypothetical protein
MFITNLKENDKEMNGELLVDNKDLRNQMASRVDVLSKVKDVFLVAGVDAMTTRQVADFYEVELGVIHSCVVRNKKEIYDDGVQKIKSSQWVIRGVKVQNRDGSGNGNVLLTNGDTVSLNAGLSLFFSLRAVLRIGMLLQESRIAREVRTQLLNTYENASVEVRTTAINEEEELYANIAKAMMSGDASQIAIACGAAFEYKNRHIKKLESHVESLQEEKNILVAGQSKLGDKNTLNLLVRAVAKNAFRGEWGLAWNQFYKFVYYRNGYNIDSRKGDGKPIDKITKNEWPEVLKTACAWAESFGVTVDKLLNETTMKSIKNFS